MYDRSGEIVYDEGWKTVDDTKSEEIPGGQTDPEQPIKNQRTKSAPVLITIELILCLLIALSLFFLKLTGSQLYKDFERFYSSSMKRTLISKSAFEAVDLSKLLSVSTPDEAEN